MESLLGATRTTSMIAFILAGSAFLSLAMGFTGLPRALAVWISDLQLSAFALIAPNPLAETAYGCEITGISPVERVARTCRQCPLSALGYRQLSQRELKLMCLNAFDYLHDCYPLFDAVCGFSATLSPPAYFRQAEGPAPKMISRRSFQLFDHRIWGELLLVLLFIFGS